MARDLTAALRAQCRPIEQRPCVPLPPAHIDWRLTAYRALHGGRLPDLARLREIRALYFTEGRTRTRT